MLSKMAQSNNVGGGGGGPAASGRRVPLSLNSGSASRIQQSSGSNGRSNSPQNNSTANKKQMEQIVGNQPFVSLKKASSSQQRSSANSAASARDVVAKEEEKKGQNGVSKSSSSKSAQNGNSNAVAKEQPKSKEKQTEKKEKESTKLEAKKEEVVSNITEKEPEAEIKATNVESKKNKAPATEVVVVDKEPDVAVVPTTPTSERKSSRRVSGANQKTPTPTKAEQIESSPVQKKQPEEKDIAAVEDVEMESLAVEASPVRIVPSAQPTATSTPGRNLFGFRSSSKQTNEVELATQPSSSPAIAPAARSFAQISGRRSIRPTQTMTPGRLGNYRCLNTSDLDTSNCTNTSMNATVGSEIPNSSSFSFSFFGRGRKRERTPPPLAGSVSLDLAHDVDVEMSPPKRARFEFLGNLPSPFSMLRKRFSKTAISSPSSRPNLDQTPPAGEDEEGEKGEVLNCSGNVIQEEEQQQQLNKSTSNEVTVGQEAGLETPKKSGSPVPVEEEGELKDVDIKKADEEIDAAANLPAADGEMSTEIEGPNRSRCAIM